MSTLARAISSSSAMCEADPCPVDAKSILPGLALAYSMNWAKVLMGRLLLTTSTLGKFTPMVIGASSLTGSYGRDMRCGAMASGPNDQNRMTLQSVGHWWAAYWWAILPQAHGTIQT